MKNKIEQGYYTDQYFNRTREILRKDNYNPVVTMQIFQKNDDVCLAGVAEILKLLHGKGLNIGTSIDGTIINSYDTVMHITGRYQEFAHLETVYLGILTRATKVATNTYRCGKETLKPILFFPARFDYYLNQQLDGYAYRVGHGRAGVSTDAQGEWISQKGSGTMPHALIASYNGDTALAMLKFAEYMNPEIPRIALVDYQNDCVRTTIEVANRMWEEWDRTKDNRYKLYGVRLDTSGNMADESIRIGRNLKKPTGVNEQLVRNVKNALKKKAEGFLSGDRMFFEEIKIFVSGGFTPEKIRQFEKNKVPVDGYGVGSSMFDGNFDFTADIVRVNGHIQSKVGRELKMMIGQEWEKSLKS